MVILTDDPEPSAFCCPTRTDPLGLFAAFEKVWQQFTFYGQNMKHAAFKKSIAKYMLTSLKSLCIL